MLSTTGTETIITRYGKASAMGFLGKAAKGMPSPATVSSYLRTRARADLARFLDRRVLNRGAAVYQSPSFEGTPTDLPGGLEASSFDELTVDNERMRRNFRSYLEMGTFAHYAGCRRVLELGAGYSTLVWGQFAGKTGAEVTSIDADFNLFETHVGDSSYADSVDEHVDTLEGVTVDPQMLREFYATPRSTVAGVAVADLVDHLDRFVTADGCPTDSLDLVRQNAPTRNWSATDLLMVDGRFEVPRYLLDWHIHEYEEDGFERHLADLSSVDRTGIVRSLLETGRTWDFVWFDSGEPSSLLEWDLLASHVEPGGFAAFHDIFFPKSMKNFVAAASVVASPDWEVVFVDARTPQGLMVARRHSVTY